MYMTSWKSAENRSGSFGDGAANDIVQNPSTMAASCRTSMRGKQCGMVEAHRSEPQVDDADAPSAPKQLGRTWAKMA